MPLFLYLRALKLSAESYKEIAPWAIKLSDDELALVFEMVQDRPCLNVIDASFYFRPELIYLNASFLPKGALLLFVSIHRISQILILPSFPCIQSYHSFRLCAKYAWMVVGCSPPA